MDKRTSQFNKDFIKKLLRKSNEGYFLVDVQYPAKLHKIHNDLPYFPEIMKFENAEKLVTNLHDKTEYFICIRNFKEALNHGLVLQKVHKVIKKLG